MKIGIISDTHNFLDPKVLRLLSGVEHILHAGDIGYPAILLELEQIAPVTAVGGNTDDASFRFNETAVIELANRKFLLHHIVEPRAPGDRIKDRIQREKPQVVVLGHTHKPFCETIGGILFFNPGYAGRQRFELQRSVAILHCDAQNLRPEYLPL